MYFYNETVGYYEGDRIDSADIEVPQRPDPWATWDGDEWVPGSPPPSANQVEQFKSLLDDPQIKALLGL